ncbi:MAG TPA: IS110 family transposase [Thiolapillus brandeum]|uniref:IS110 family transposase n=1 Tax=Thiolapillus brandeum TaxID=1076588 RepID=A0A831RUE5_9GAMM|nr:IS110 family transposase [Thiolapillus brandeum]
MREITTIGMDLAKNVFHVIGCDARGKVQLRKQLRRHQVLAWFARLKPCRVGMEACASSHYWGRELRKLGHEVKLIAAQHVKAFLRGNKNDYNDALAIAEAVVRPEMRFVAIKSAQEQDIQALCRLREQRVKECTALGNQIRGLLGEYGISIRKGKAGFKRRVVELLEDADSGLSDRFRRLLREAWHQYQELEAHLQAYDQELARVVRENEACQRLQTIPGFGPVVASVFFSRIGSGEGFRRGREVSAALGLVPRQHSSGGKEVLLGISKRGDRYLRGLLIHGARAVVARAGSKRDRLSRWVMTLVARRGHNKAVVALANKMARMGWAVLAHKTAC